MIKKLVALSFVAVILLAIPASHQMWGKGHVPAHKEQVCHKGTVITVGRPAMSKHILRHGDCRIDAATKTPPLFSGDACDASDCS